MSGNPNPSKLDQGQIIQQVFDGTSDRLRVDADLTVSSATVEVDLNYETASVSLGDSITNNTLKINADGSIDTNVIISATSDSIKISDGTDTLAINADGSINTTLPSGAATAANQTTGNNSLAAVEGIIASTKQQIVKAADTVAGFVWLDYGLSTQRLSQINYTSATVHVGTTARKTFSYTLTSGTYRLDSIAWSLV